MKSLFLIIIALVAMSPCFAQRSLDHFIAQYAEEDNVNNLNLQGSILQLAGNFNQNTAEKRALTKLNKLTALWFDDFNPVSRKEVSNLLKNLAKDDFESLVMLKDNDTNVNFLVRENGKYITGVILVVDNDDQFLLINLQGQLKFEDLGNIDLDIDGMEHFKKLPKNRSSLKRA